ncbi:MAG: rhomboid family intramembrane serine protease [Gammaproteobacteria bacterium]
MTILNYRNIFDPKELVPFLITTNIMMFLTALLMAPAAVNTSPDLMFFLSPGVGVLFKLGASGTLPVLSEDRWWTLITANYLHGGLLHLLFNLAALRSVGKIDIDIFGPSRFFLIYFLGGVAAMAVSSLAGIPLTLGASGAVCALIGSMSYDDWRAHKGNLKMRITSVGIWVLLIVGTGVLLPNVNNWAHAVGYASGFFLGFCFWPRVTYEERTLFRVAATTCMLITICTLLYGLLLS